MVTTSGSPFNKCYLSQSKCTYSTRSSCCKSGYSTGSNGNTSSMCSNWVFPILGTTPLGWSWTQSGNQASVVRCQKSGDNGMSGSTSYVSKTAQHPVWCCK